MPSYRQARRTALDALLGRRLDDERQAERRLAEATAAQRRTEEEAARLEAVALDARAAAAAARAIEAVRAVAPPGGRAADAQAARRYQARLDGAVKDANASLSRHREGTLADAIAAREAARLAHLSARRRREVVEKAIARRKAAADREHERRAEAEQDDSRAGGPKTLKNP